MFYLLYLLYLHSSIHSLMSNFTTNVFMHYFPPTVCRNNSSVCRFLFFFIMDWNSNFIEKNSSMKKIKKIILGFNFFLLSYLFIYFSGISLEASAIATRTDVNRYRTYKCYFGCFL